MVTAVPAAAASSPVGLVNCAGHGKVRPAVYDIGCMPSSEYVSGLKWTSWRSVAFGSGSLKVNNCTPTCAGGKYISHPILTVLWRAEAWPKHSDGRYFTRLTWIFTGKRPGARPGEPDVQAARQLGRDVPTPNRLGARWRQDGLRAPPGDRPVFTESSPCLVNAPGTRG